MIGMRTMVRIRSSRRIMPSRRPSFLTDDGFGEIAFTVFYLLLLVVGDQKPPLEKNKI